jgi:hypothetical protein
MIADLNFNFPLTPIVITAFGVILLLFIFISIMAMYSLIHFGRSRILGATVSAIYSLLVILLLIHAVISLTNL